MFHFTEEKFQGWRALAAFEDGSERLLFVGRSTTQVRDGYADAFAELLDEEERGRVARITLQCWQGAADQGRWVAKSALNVPVRKAAPRPAGTASAANSKSQVPNPNLVWDLELGIWDLPRAGAALGA